MPAFFEVALDHPAGDAPLAGGDLRRYFVRHGDLPLVLLAAVAVRDVDHHLLAQARGAQCIALTDTCAAL